MGYGFHTTTERAWTDNPCPACAGTGTVTVPVSTPPEQFASCRVGTNGASGPFTGVWLAAYVAARRPEANRVCAWLDFRWAIANGGPRPERNRPSTVDALLAYNGDDPDEPITACMPADATIELGLKFKPATDPVLVGLVDLWRKQSSGNLADHEWTPDEVVRIAAAMDELLAFTEPSSWHENCADAVDVFRFAAERGLGVSGG